MLKQRRPQEQNSIAAQTKESHHITQTSKGRKLYLLKSDIGRDRFTEVVYCGFHQGFGGIKKLTPTAILKLYF